MQELPNILQNPRVHYRVHKGPPLGVYPKPNQSSPYHPNLRSILILSPTYILIFLEATFLLAFPPISYMHSSLHHACYIFCPSHPPWLDHSNTIWRRVQVMKLLIMQFSPTSCHLIPTKSKFGDKCGNNEKKHDILEKSRITLRWITEKQDGVV
jgi:hypothetical protein